MNLREQAAQKALEYVDNGMLVGLGTGNTAGYFIDLLGARLRAGALRSIRGVPTSRASAERAAAAGIPLTSLAEHPALDIAVDGADEVDPRLGLIKGLGRALLREKIIEIHTDQLIIIVDEAKLVSRLGRGPLPVEIVPFEAAVQVRWLAALGCRAELWLEEDGSPAVTDNGNYLVRCWFADGNAAGIPDPHALARSLADRPGIVEHGLFLDMARRVIVAAPGGVRVLEREP
jgi:ribose 5-phosphate isomerase A